MSLLSALGNLVENMQVINNEYTNITISVSGNPKEVRDLCDFLEKHKEAMGICSFIVCDNDLRTLLSEKKVMSFSCDRLQRSSSDGWVARVMRRCLTDEFHTKLRSDTSTPSTKMLEVVFLTGAG